jgi:hypothetical protein
MIPSCLDSSSEESLGNQVVKVELTKVSSQFRRAWNFLRTVCERRLNGFSIRESGVVERFERGHVV